MRSLLTAAALAVMALTPGCGGGGSGSSGPNPASVTVTLASPSSVTGDLVISSTMPTVYVTAQVSGDWSSMNGQTVVVTVDDPDALLSKQDAPQIQVSGYEQYTLTLPGGQLTTPGHYTGHWTLHVTCKGMPLGGTPLTVPYDVTVEQGLQLSTSNLQVNTAFGDPVSTHTLQAVLPNGIQSIQVTNTTVGGNYANAYGVMAAAATDGTISVKCYPAAPGTYPYTFQVTATGYLDDQTLKTFTGTFSLNYQVEANDQVDFVLAPTPTYSFTLPAGTINTSYFSCWLIPNTGVTQNLQGSIQFLTCPDTAVGNPLATIWMSYYGGPSNFAYGDTGSPYANLTPGTYTAQINTGYTKNGVDTFAVIPVTLVVTP